MGMPPMNNQTHFQYQIDMLTIDGEKVVEQLAGVNAVGVAGGKSSAPLDNSIRRLVAAFTRKEGFV
jgi:hypothetical protein